MASLEGGCQCGAVRYVLSVDQLVAYTCHCRECQKQAASAFGISVPVPSNRLHIQGAMNVYRRPTDSGANTDCWFCKICGSRLYHQGDRETDWVTLKGGTLDRSDLIKPSAHIWVKRKQPWVILPPEAITHDAQPPDLDGWRHALIPTSV